MKFLKPGLMGREPLLMDPRDALDLYRKTENLGMVDKLVQMVADRPAPTMNGRIAVIPLMGVVGMGLSPLEKALGGVDINDFRKAWKTAEADPTVSEIWMAVNSPGGRALGVEEAASMVRNTAKPTAAFCEMACSAAYYIAAAADRTLGMPSANVGSIGVRIVVEDMSKAYEEAGIKVYAITSGELKGGDERTAVTQAELDDLKAYAEELGAQFRADVRKTRKGIPDSAMQGQTFTGRKAAQLGLLTGLYDTLEDAINGIPSAS